MALLDPRIQQIFYRRLRSYGFINPRFHPEKLQSFSSVVINGGGSWQQDTDWEFPKTTRFLMDTAAVPFMVQVTAGIGALECDGVYVATTTKQNGKSVYVQVSRNEFYGFEGQVGFKRCLTPAEQSKLKDLFLDSQGKRQDACSPRILVCRDLNPNPKWGIQLLPGYGSQLFICEFLWKEKLDTYANLDANCFSSLNFHNFEADLQHSSVTIAHIHEHASRVLTTESLKAGHCFSFGPMKIAKSNLKASKLRKQYRPSALYPQGWHSDGPLVYNARVFDSDGKLMHNAPACRKRSQGDWNALWNNPLSEHLPEHLSILQESFSALFGVFTGTYIQTPPSSDCQDRDIDALNVVIPLGCAILFTFAWKHRGKGDDGHRATTQSPVAVHARPHFYCYSSDLRRMPSIDLEASLEFLSTCALKQPNAGSLIQMLDTLQTFDRVSAAGHWDAKDVHSLFSSQEDLETYVCSQLEEQRAKKQTNAAIKDCRNWSLKLSEDNDYPVSIIYSDAANCSDQSVNVASACFDSDHPSFTDSKGMTYNLVGAPRGMPSGVAPLHMKLAASMLDNWCESRLVSLLSALEQAASNPGSSESPMCVASDPSSSDSHSDRLPQSAHPTLLQQSYPAPYKGTWQVNTALPTVAAGIFPPDVPLYAITWKDFSECTIDNVGRCHVFHVHTSNLGYDTVAIQVEGEDTAYSINNSTTKCHDKSVEFTWTTTDTSHHRKHSVSMSLRNVSAACLAWAAARQPNDFTMQHFQAFETNDWIRVECGGDGNCFYHSVLFLLRLFLPEFMIENSKGNNISVQRTSVTHQLLRKATCAHLRQCQEIPATVLTIIGDDIKKYCTANARLKKWVEEPIIWAFCSFVCDLEVQVHHISSRDPILFISPSLQVSASFKLWCDDTHYQVLIPSTPKVFTMFML
jgi:hypothetical protein